MASWGKQNDTNGLFESELKLVTSLFVDLVGSLEAISKIGIQKASLLLEESRESLTGIAHRHSGTIATIAGDGILFLFGAPVANSKHAANACLAALEMIGLTKDADWPLPGTTVRVGICTGETLVRPVSTDIGWHYDATGVSVHLASRLQALAEPDTALTDRLTRDLAFDRFLFENLGDQPIRGIVDALPVYRLVQVSRTEQKEMRGVQAPFIGREEEILRLIDICRARSSDLEKVVVVAGDAGIGKSRLMFESHKILVAGEAFPALYCRGFYGHFDPCSGIRACVEQLVPDAGKTNQDGFLSNALKDTTLDKLSPDDELSLRSLHYELFGREENRGAIEGSYLNDLIARKLATIRRGFEVLLQHRQQHGVPAILIDEFFELDSESREIFFQLMSAGSAFKGNFILSCRPENLAGLIERDVKNIEILKLGGLSEDAATQLATDIRSTIRNPDTTVSDQVANLSDIVRKSAGNPLFLIEIVRAMKHVRTGSKASEDLNFTVQTPLLQAVIAERIDQLTRAQKHSLKVASILGEMMPEALLSQVLADLGYELSTIGDLVNDGILGRLTTHPTPRLYFKHPLFREITENSIIERDRVVFHATAYRALRTFSSAGQNVNALLQARHAYFGHLWDEACDGYLAAATESNERAMNSHALELLELALGASKNLKGTELRSRMRVKILLEMRNPLYQIADLDGVKACLDQASDALIENEYPRVKGRILAFESHLLWLQGLPSAARKCAARIRQIADETEDEVLRVRAAFHSGLANYSIEEHWTSVRNMQHVVRAIEKGNLDNELGVNPGLSVLAMSYGARSLMFLGQTSDSVALALAAEELVQQSEDIFAHIIARLSAGVVLSHAGDIGRAGSSFEAAGRLLDTVEARLMRPIFGSYFGFFTACTGAVEQGETLIRRAIGESNDIGLGLELGRKHLNACLCHLALGNREEAHAAVQASLEASTIIEAKQSAALAADLSRHLLSTPSARPDFDALSAPPFAADPAVRTFVRSFRQTAAR
ncbi:ATP-binding protein [Ruegeria meonggei]|uniref:Adenylate cyclase 1 n=1 Tax=Ruegeria meonggei TaxID=1446476 RepID=A0A1X6ZP42_9RHOB|nr:adenylate/guanylate cyclase domain-containing protein [Ruegeria meonggei]SLN55408.1 Adenylate cyclase 1 [Ruegeria meonggei]